ncbi:cysteine desulfurase [Candidatus Uhrbacteria bacterium]|nr:cysteine desulfurase [Candidatus Uhrbacteria bacterium]
MRTKPTVYLDHAAATPLDPRVAEAMVPYLRAEYGNPSALYALGRAAREAVDNARETVARILNCRAAEIVFTGSGTESDNLAVFGVAKNYAHNSPHPSLTSDALKGRSPTEASDLGEGADTNTPLRVRGGRGVTKGHLITTAIEHHAVLNPCRALEKEDYAVTYLKVEHDGLITPEQLRAAIRPDTVLISIMYANNEIGTIEPIAALTRAVRAWKKEHGRKENDPPFFHTDACQAAGYLDMDVGRLGVDLLTLNASKIYGPKGVGALYVRRGIKLQPCIYGGGQEFGLRSGTENVAAIVGMGKALELVVRLRDQEIKRLSGLRDRLIAGILARVEGAELNGHPTQRLPNNVNISISGIEGEAMLFYLDEHGISAATGSACESAGPDPSHVVQALGKSRDAARSSIRFTLGRGTMKDDVEYVLEVLPGIVQKLRHK